MSVNVENIQKTLGDLGKLKESFQEVQTKAQDVLLNVGEKAAAQYQEAAEGLAQQLQQAQVDAQGMIEQANAALAEAATPGIAENVADSLTNVAIERSAMAQQVIDEASKAAVYVEDWANQAQEIVNHVSAATAEKSSWLTSVLGDLNFGGDPELWGDMGLKTVIGFGVVFVVLVLLIFIMKGMGAVFTRQKKAEKAAKAAAAGVVMAEEDHHEAISDQEIAAAIITALKLYKSNLHDQESEVITIHRITRAYSPWSSKIHGLTQVPERK